MGTQGSAASQHHHDVGLAIPTSVSGVTRCRSVASSIVDAMPRWKGTDGGARAGCGGGIIDGWSADSQHLDVGLAGLWMMIRVP